MSAVGRWRIRGETVVPKAQPTAPPAIAARPPLQPQPAPQVDLRREVDAWIDAYRRAYEEKDVEKLIALGVVPSGQRAKMAQILQDLENLEVRITARNVDLQGDDTAAVTLTRVDSFSAGGTRTNKEIQIKKTLRRRNGAWVAQ